MNIIVQLRRFGRNLALAFLILSSPGSLFGKPAKNPAQAGKLQSASQALIPDPQKLEPMVLRRLASPPAIDGSLDDDAWQQPPLTLGEWRTYNPSYGETMAQKTRVWAAYDDNYLYFAFRCLDPDPSQIKTSIAKRDTIWNDDWVGLSLDSMASGQSTYDMFVNPSGIQGDILTNSTSGENVAPDWVWDSAGKVNAEGYAVELRVPFKSLRFKSGADVKMNVLFWRRVSRLGVSASWPDLPRGQSIFTRHAPIRMQNVKHPLVLEAIPNFTYSVQQTRESPGKWGAADTKPDAGLTVKYGLTSTITADGTVRPDFSQVESDAFQVEVNRRFPVFYSEKRPFFMEGMGTFELSGSGGDGNMRTAVHTRRIQDPLYGFKLTGSVGKFTFATLSASDRAPGRTDESDPNYGERKNYNIGRTLYGFSKGSYAGALYADTEFAGRHNRVFAADTSIQMGEHQNIGATVIGSQTSSESDADRQGMAGQMNYSYSSKRFDTAAQLEHYDRDFMMDTAFYNRTGITGGWGYAGVNFYPDQEKFKWFKKFNPFYFTRGYRDRIQGGDDLISVAGFRFSFTRQGMIQINLVKGREPWAGRSFDIRAKEFNGGAQLLRWLNVRSSLSLSRSIYYDPENPFLGNDIYLATSVTLQPNSNLNQLFSYTREAFSRLTDGGRVYTVDILHSRTAYQINKRFAVRAIIQYDSSQSRVLGDLLGSYDLVPGTVAYVGYGSLLERNAWDGSRYIPGSGPFVNTQRGLFIKLSYLHRF
jgi:hypothetical protein